VTSKVGLDPVVPLVAKRGESGRNFPQTRGRNANANLTCFSSLPSSSHWSTWMLYRTVIAHYNMNWTGGSLQRTKNANKGTLQKQKAYFARARTHLQNRSNSPVVPFRPNYLQNDVSFELGSQISLSGSRSVRHTGKSARRHREAPVQEAGPEDGGFDALALEESLHAVVSPRALRWPNSPSRRLGASANGKLHRLCLPKICDESEVN
jgi:hypothetical protein